MTGCPSHADLIARLRTLSQMATAPSPVVSVYLNTHWRDEHQRERARVFLKNELRRARVGATAELDADLAWVERQGEALVGKSEACPNARAIALFACRSAGLREVLPLRAPVDDFFVVGAGPHLRRLAALIEAAPLALIVLVDGVSARLVPLLADGAGEVVTLEGDVHGRHRQGGWQLLAQSRYQRHIQEQRGHHFDAFAAALTELVDELGVERILLAGSPRAVAVFRSHLDRRIGRMVAGAIAGAAHEPVDVLVARAMELLGRRKAKNEAAEVQEVVVEAAKGGAATAGVEATLDAASRGAVRRLYLLKTFHEAGRRCSACGVIQPGSGGDCRVCGGDTEALELGEALVERVVATGGSVDMVEEPWLGRVEGVAALLRYSL
jgi:peptide subunit release factor 1 (eRF1)